MAPPQPEVRARVLISGLVQGVNFRASTRAAAGRLNLRGWVRNLPDGDVEAAFQGPRDAVERMVSWCHRGPAPARVDQVRVEWQRPRDAPKGFRIRR